jgi:hypothetical protein
VQLLLPGFEGSELGVESIVELPTLVAESFVGLLAEYILENVQLG